MIYNILVNICGHKQLTGHFYRLLSPTNTHLNSDIVNEGHFQKVLFCNIL